MSVSQRMLKIRKTTESRNRLLKTASSRRPRILEMSPAPAGKTEAKLGSVYLVAKRPPLSIHPPLWRYLARLVYKRIGWCPDHGIEYIGIYTSEAEARHAAGGDGYFYMELPLNSSLPDEVCQFGTHDFPHSEASHEYRNRRMPFVARRRKELDSQLADLAEIDGRLLKLNECIEGKCIKAI